MLRKIILFIAVATITAFFVQFISPKTHQNIPVIAITQIIEHNTLDVVREGIFMGLKERGFEDGKNVRIVYQNAHGQMTTAAQIVQHFANLKPKVLVALSTQSAQLLQPMAQQQNIPLIFSAVTDPVAAKLLKSVTVATPGITGVSDYMDPLPQINMMKAFLPSLKTLGVLYNPSEINSTLFLYGAFKKAAVTEKIELVFSPLNNTSEVVSATRALLGKVDAIYFPNDNTAMAAVSSIVSVAHKENIPVFANDKASVERGALAALAYNRIQMGKDTAALIVDALKEGAALTKQTKVGGAIQTIINKKTLEALKLKVPASVKNFIFVEGE